MARSASFTAVPGRGGIAMGVIGVAAAVVARRQPDAARWLLTWLVAAVVAVPVGVAAMIVKARRYGVPLLSPAGRRFAQGFLPAMLAAAMLTAMLVRAQAFAFLPPTWLLLYGAGVMAGGAASVTLLAWIGVAFIACGIAAALTPAAWNDLWLGIGFGVVQIVSGFIIARKHGG
jgi:uncharacterized membrane protein HdeD (DUF308 family)